MPSTKYTTMSTSTTNNTSNKVEFARRTRINSISSNNDNTSSKFTAEELQSIRQNNLAGKRIIIHHVLPTDTVAGVAISYGIRISDLRRFNNMYHNDAIHLRPRIIIPLDYCSISDIHQKISQGMVEVITMPAEGLPMRTSSSGEKDNQDTSDISDMKSSSSLLATPLSTTSSTGMPASTMGTTPSSAMNTIKNPDQVYSHFLSGKSKHRHTLGNPNTIGSEYDDTVLDKCMDWVIVTWRWIRRWVEEKTRRTWWKADTALRLGRYDSLDDPLLRNDSDTDEHVVHL